MGLILAFLGLKKSRQAGRRAGGQAGGRAGGRAGRRAGGEAGGLRPTQGSQGGPCCIAPGCLLRSPGDLENNARGEGEGEGNRVLALATVTKLCPGSGEVSETAARGFRLEFFFQL